MCIVKFPTYSAPLKIIQSDLSHHTILFGRLPILRLFSFACELMLQLFGVRTLDKRRSCLYAATLDAQRERVGTSRGKARPFEPLGVPFDSLQPSERFPIQDGGRNSQTKDYLTLAPHKIRLHCRLACNLVFKRLLIRICIPRFTSYISAAFPLD